MLPMYMKLKNIPLTRVITNAFECRYNVTVQRCYLTSAYECCDAWNNRLTDPIIQNIKPIEYFYELLRKRKRDGKIFAIDADIFINSIHNEQASSISSEIIEALQILRRSKETIHAMDSTAHNAIRLLFVADKHDDIMKIISDPLNYGVFLDHYLANVLMSSFLVRENFTAAARVASTLMLQEDYGPLLSRHLVLLSCFCYSYNLETNEKWLHYNIPEEPEEEVKVAVQYVRNYYHDDHFDIREPERIVGKTLAWLTADMEDGKIKSNAQILGWSLYEKWSKLERALDNITTKRESIDKRVHSIVSSQVEKCEEEKLKMTLISHLSGLKSTGDVDILSDIKSLVKEEASRTETEDISKQVTKYENFMKLRREALDKHLEMHERHRLLEEIERKKEDLRNREDVIYFFDNEDQIEVALEKKRAMYPKFDEVEETSLISENDDDYIPPEVHKRNTV